MMKTLRDRAAGFAGLKNFDQELRAKLLRHDDHTKV
jgi:hypothetical protein